MGALTDLFTFPADAAPPPMRAPPFLLLLLLVATAVCCAFLPLVPATSSAAATSPVTHGPCIGTCAPLALAGHPDKAERVL